jgi:CMP-2-keto-3-deoxyoctulosonic acid synthetase
VQVSYSINYFVLFCIVEQINQLQYHNEQIVIKFQEAKPTLSRIKLLNNIVNLLNQALRDCLTLYRHLKRHKTSLGDHATYNVPKVKLLSLGNH